MIGKQPELIPDAVRQNR